MSNNNIYLQKNEDNLLNNPINNDDIYLIQQFFIHKNHIRQKEILYCLKQNIKLGIFKKIILFNERIYTKEELNLNENEIKQIQQVNIKKWLTYKLVFQRIYKMKLLGYIVFSNSDIFFDKTILNVRKSCLSITKSIYSLLRFEFVNPNKKLGFCKLFIHPRTNKPRNDSQDTWIYHTSQFNFDNENNKKNIENFLNDIDFPLGKPGCDNKITYELTKYGYKCINVPWNVKTYHYHTTNIRNYSVQDVLPKPYLYLEPIL